MPLKLYRQFTNQTSTGTESNARHKSIITFDHSQCVSVAFVNALNIMSNLTPYLVVIVQYVLRTYAYTHISSSPKH